MTERFLMRVLIALALLIVVYGGVRLVAALTRPRAVTGGPLAVAIDRLRTDTLLSVVLTAPGGERIELRRASPYWTANGFPADSGAIERMTAAVQAARVVDLVAQSEQSHARLGVSPDSTWRVELTGNRSTVRFLLGREGRDYNNTYARDSAAADVYEISGGLRWALARPLSDWRDKVVARADTAAVRTLIIGDDRASVELAREDSVWRPRGRARGEVDRLRVGDVLAELRRFDAIGVAKDTARFDGKERRWVVAIGAAGDTLASLEFRGTGGTWLVRARGDSTVFETSTYRVDRVAPKPADVVKVRAP